MRTQSASAEAVVCGVWGSVAPAFALLRHSRIGSRPPAVTVLVWCTSVATPACSVPPIVHMTETITLAVIVISVAVKFFSVAVKFFSRFALVISGFAVSISYFAIVISGFALNLLVCSVIIAAVGNATAGLLSVS